MKNKRIRTSTNIAKSGCSAYSHENKGELFFRGEHPEDTFCDPAALNPVRLRAVDRVTFIHKVVNNCG